MRAVPPDDLHRSMVDKVGATDDGHFDNDLGHSRFSNALLWSRRLSLCRRFVQRAFHSAFVLVQHVRVDHSCPDIRMAEEFLDDAYIVAVFQEVCGKRVAEGVAAASFYYSCAENRLLH